VTAIKQKPELTAAKIDFLTSALHEHIAVGQDQLTALGQQRALALQRALLTDTGIDPARIFLVANDKAKEKDGAVRVELSLR
jgi:type IV pilus biogenesis protein CpaD/CtpE